MPIPRAYGAQIADATAINAGSISPSLMGYQIYNNTGSPLTPGTLVYRNGWNSTPSLPTVSLSDNHTAGAHAQYIVGSTAIPNNTVGTVYKHWLSTPTLDTHLAAIGDPVYLDSSLGAGSGAWTLTANSGPNNRLETVGHVVVSDALVGQIDFDVQTHKFSKCGAVELQPLTVGTAALAIGGVTPDNMGLTVWNASGSDIPAGSLVFLSGWRAAQNLPQISLANNNAFGQSATYVTAQIVVNGNTGIVRPHVLSAATLNTNAGSVGDAVFCGTAGGWTLNQPTGPTTNAQVVGRVVVKSATVGQIDFDLESNRRYWALGNTEIQALAITAALIATGTVTGTQLSPAAAVHTLQVSLGTLATAADEEVLIVAPVAGSLSLLTLSGKDALATDDTNFQALTLINKGPAGAGTTDMLSQTAGAKTTKTTGGQALVAYGKTVFPLHATAANLIVAKGDTLALKVTHNGTPANTVTECVAQIEFTFTT